MASLVSSERVGLPPRYRVVRHLRTGGMAALWQAHDDVLDRDVAVKVLTEHLGADPAARSRFEREARAAARLSSHPHVVTIYDVGEWEGSAFIVMELMARGSLSDRLATGCPVPRETALGWLRDAACALDDAHAAGIVHRDVKPGNMLLDGRGDLALADFGIALVAHETQLTRTGEILGTMAYTAPEQALGRPATPASDRYSLAVVAYELLAGRRPFDAAQPTAQARAHVEDEPPPTGSPAVDAVLRRGLAKDPTERWGSAAGFVTALERGLARGETTAATAVARPAAAAEAGPTVRARAPRAPAPVPVASTDDAPKRRSRAPWAAAGALALVAGIVLAAGLTGSDERRPAPATLAGKTTSAERSAPAQPTEKTQTAQPPTASTPAPKAKRPGSRTPSAATTGAGDLAAARRFQLAGYQARLGGRLDEALALSQRALAACGDGRALDPCGYALFEVGAVLRRMGRGAEAAGFLRRRLSTYGDNAAGEVSRELALATGRAAGPGRAKKPKKSK